MFDALPYDVRLMVYVLLPSSDLWILTQVSATARMDVFKREFLKKYTKTFEYMYAGSAQYIRERIDEENSVLPKVFECHATLKYWQYCNHCFAKCTGGTKISPLYDEIRLCHECFSSMRAIWICEAMHEFALSYEELHSLDSWRTMCRAVLRSEAEQLAETLHAPFGGIAKVREQGRPEADDDWTDEDRQQQIEIERRHDEIRELLDIRLGEHDISVLDDWTDRYVKGYADLEDVLERAERYRLAVEFARQHHLDLDDIIDDEDARKWIDDERYPREKATREFLGYLEKCRQEYEEEERWPAQRQKEQRERQLECDRRRNEIDKWLATRPDLNDISMIADWVKEYVHGDIDKENLLLRVERYRSAVQFAQQRELDKDRLINNEPVREWIDSGKCPQEQVFQRYLDYFEKCRQKREEAEQRRELLSTELAKHGLSIRSDSILSSQYIMDNAHGLEYVVRVMVEMHWLHTNTNYAKVVSDAISQLHNEYYRPYGSEDYSFRDEIEDVKEKCKTRCVRMYAGNGGDMSSLPSSLHWRLSSKKWR